MLDPQGFEFSLLLFSEGVAGRSSGTHLPLQLYAVDLD